uniref:Uncharacterized protein n=1 Tax=Timema douglasi TaxID=61478 RepID=A0A7R8VMR7_TIMDO|nr:unnamed protein product [Timema douglasi]
MSVGSDGRDIIEGGVYPHRGLQPAAWSITIPVMERLYKYKARVGRRIQNRRMGLRHFSLPATLLVAILLGWSPQRAQGNKDGFNLYKDLLRGKSEESSEPELRVEPPHKLIYFFRTPLLAPVGDGPDHMLSRDSPEESTVEEANQQAKETRSHTPTSSRSSLQYLHGPGALVKRGPGSILTWVLSAKPPTQSDLSFLFSLLGSSSLRNSLGPDGMVGHTAFVATMGK